MINKFKLYEKIFFVSINQSINYSISSNIIILKFGHNLTNIYI